MFLFIPRDFTSMSFFMYSLQYKVQYTGEQVKILDITKYILKYTYACVCLKINCISDFSKFDIF